MNRTLLATAICAGLFVAGGAYAQTTAGSTQNQNDQSSSSQSQTKSKEKKQTLQAITVTGSLIPQAQVETASPVITITSKDIEKQGFRNVYDALQTMTVSTGSVQGNQATSTGTFTPGAEVISLFGLDPGFTLIMINGHPLADYPIPYNGGESIADLSNIPTAMVDHIDILTGGQSSLYGSSAIAGVVNIVLKKNIEGTNLDFRVGGYENGGGTNERLQFSGGHTWNKLSATYALTVTNQQPLSVGQSFWPSRLNNPKGPPYVAGRDFLQLDPFSGAYVDPGAAACQQSSSLFGGTLGYQHRAHSGNYCGSYYDTSSASLLNGSVNVNGYVNLTYRLNDNAELYADMLYGFSKQTINPGNMFWSFANPALAQSSNSFSNVFWDNTLQNFESIQRFFAPEETGGLGGMADHIRTRQYNTDIGIRGNLGQSNWAYDAYYNRSQVNTDEHQRWPLSAPFQNYYLGAQQGTDPGNPYYGISTYGFPAFTPNTANLYKPLTPAQWMAMTGVIQSQSVSWQQNAHGTLTNTDLFELPGGSAGFAAIAEWGNQSFHSPVAPGLIAGDFNNRTGTEGGGSRSRWAVGGELRLPIFKPLTVDVSARYDSYSSTGRTDAKPTYKLGIEYRPWDTLLLRANYATAFRAPDMYYLFQRPSGFYTGATDYYLCRLSGYTQSTIGNCQIPSTGSIFSLYQGSPNLKDVTAKSWGYGVVWSPTDKFTLKADYTHIAISNEIQTQSVDALLQDEADCRIGTSFGGQTYDINSALCQQVLSQVHRYPANYSFGLAANQLQNIQTYPINIGKERLDGVQATASYKFGLGRYGDLNLSAEYYVELNHEQQQQPSDPYLDLLHNYNSYEFKTRSSAAVSWAVDKWTTTLFGTLYGKSVNYGGTGIVGRWATFNGSVNYQVDKDVTVQLTVNNLFNRAPPTEYSLGSESVIGPPYYNYYSFNGYGRMTWLEIQMHF